MEKITDNTYKKVQEYKAPQQLYITQNGAGHLEQMVQEQHHANGRDQEDARHHQVCKEYR